MNPYNRPYDPNTGEPSDIDQNQPGGDGMDSEDWMDIYSNPDYDFDNDHSMDY